jgi:hypothetical protein
MNPDKPLLPAKEEVDFLIHRVQTQIERSRDTLPKEAIAEYQKALNVYKSIRSKGN